MADSINEMFPYIQDFGYMGQGLKNWFNGLILMHGDSRLPWRNI
jgi:hypothetical protein